MAVRNRLVTSSLSVDQMRDAISNAMGYAKPNYIGSTQKGRSRQERMANRG